MRSRIITMQPDGTRRFQHALHFHQPHGHENQIRHHPLAMRLAGGLNHGIGGWVAVSQLAMFMHVHVIERPGILEGRARRLAANGSLVGAIGIERRIQVDQVNAVAVHPPKDGEVVACPDGARHEIGGHSARLDPSAGGNLIIDGILECRIHRVQPCHPVSFRTWCLFILIKPYQLRVKVCDLSDSARQRWSNLDPMRRCRWKTVSGSREGPSLAITWLTTYICHYTQYEA